MQSQMAQDPRKHPRTEWNRLGEVSSLTGQFICNCFVKDISAGGACIIVPTMEIVPDYFRLNYGVDDLTPKCRVRRRNGNEMGVEFYRNK